jgi:hypothetical protein
MQNIYKNKYLLLKKNYGTKTTIEQKNTKVSYKNFKKRIPMNILRAKVKKTKVFNFLEIILS